MDPIWSYGYALLLWVSGQFDFRSIQLYLNMWRYVEETTHWNSSTVTFWTQSHGGWFRWFSCQFGWFLGEPAFFFQGWVACGAQRPFGIETHNAQLRRSLVNLHVIATLLTKPQTHTLQMVACPTYINWWTGFLNHQQPYICVLITSYFPMVIYWEPLDPKTIQNHRTWRL